MPIVAKILKPKGALNVLLISMFIVIIITITINLWKQENVQLQTRYDTLMGVSRSSMHSGANMQSLTLGKGVVEG